ncbi:MAG TPA: hypothetical protein VEM58_17145, partial [Streptosporangiaceae bacterium]|nr:hypothetical protein [Streptosporangiaceae bacterium]
MSGLQWPPRPASQPPEETRNGHHRRTGTLAPVRPGEAAGSGSVGSGPTGSGSASSGTAGSGTVGTGPGTGPSGSGPQLPEWAREPIGLADSGLLAGVPEILAMIADMLPDRAEQGEVMPLIRDAARAWSQRQLRQGSRVPAAADLEAVAQAVYDQRYGLGPLAAYLRDRDVENVDVNGCDQVWVTYSTGERVAA